MKSKSKSAVAEKDKGTPEPSLLERLETYFKEVFFILSIERELHQEIKRFRKEVQMSAVKALKKRRPGYERAGKKTPKSTKRATNRSLPKVLTAKAQPSDSINVFNFYSETKSQVAKIERAIWRCLIPDQEDLAMIAERELQSHELKVDACKRLIKEASTKEHELRSKAQQARREADKITRRAARQKKANHPAIKQATEINQQAIKLERTASKNSELQRHSLDILERRLMRLETECLEKGIELEKRLVLASTLRTERANGIIRKSGRAIEAAKQAIAEVEQKTVDREERLTEALKTNGGTITLSPTMFMPMEKRIELNEEMAKASIEKIANLPAIETKSMSAVQTKKALSDFNLANKEMIKWCASLVATEMEIIQALAKYRQQATVWKERQMMAELKENAELAKQAKIHRIGALDASLHVGQSLEDIRAMKESGQQRLDEINLVSAKLAERLAEIEQANRQTKEQATNVN
ncbi:MAG: hypothetical protein WC028_05320 [Candidatus Obscuribacterales bacterium]